MRKKCINLFPPQTGEGKAWNFHVEMNGVTAEGSFASENKFAFDQAMEYLSKCDSLKVNMIKKMEGCPCGKQ